MTLDAQNIIRTINRADGATRLLRITARTLPSTAGERVGGTSPDAPAPLSLDLLDQAELMHHCLRGWARITEEEHGTPLPPDQTEQTARYLLEHATWITEQTWAEDLVLELRDHIHTAKGMLGLLTPRTLLPEPCRECSERQWVYRETPPVVRCRQGHESPLGEHLQSREVETVTHAQAAWVLGITRQAIGMAIKRGTLTAGPKGGVTLNSVRVRLAREAMLP